MPRRGAATAQCIPQPKQVAVPVSHIRHEVAPPRTSELQGGGGYGGEVRRGGGVRGGGGGGVRGGGGTGGGGYGGGNFVPTIIRARNDSEFLVAPSYGPSDILGSARPGSAGWTGWAAAGEP